MFIHKSSGDFDTASRHSKDRVMLSVSAVESCNSSCSWCILIPSMSCMSCSDPFGLIFASAASNCCKYVVAKFKMALSLPLTFWPQPQLTKPQQLGSTIYGSRSYSHVRQAQELSIALKHAFQCQPGITLPQRASTPFTSTYLNPELSGGASQTMGCFLWRKNLRGDA